MKKEGSSASSFPFLSVLTLIFVTAKIFNVINWSWWLVFAPIWAPISILLLIILAAAIAGAATKVN